MAGSHEHRPRRRKVAPQAAVGTNISSLPDDIVLQIFLWLPSLAALARAACACRAWRRAVASSPDFRCRFRVLHRPPLLGLFFDTAARCQYPCVPAFVPIRPRDSDLAAAVRGGDFFLTSLHDRSGDDVILDCHGGYILLTDKGDEGVEKFAVLNPLMRRCRHVFGMSLDDAFGHLHPYLFKARLACSEKDATSFRVVLLANEDDCICASVFSSETGKWSVSPWVNIPQSSDGDDFRSNLVWLEDESRMQANGFLYWVYFYGQRHLVSLNTVTMKFSFAEMPLCLGRHCTYDAGETKDGETCIVFSDRFNIGVLMQTRDDDGVERWVLNRVMNLVQTSLVPDRTKLFVFAVRDGYAYLSTSAKSKDPRVPCWFMSLCLETMRLEKLFRRTFDCDAHPYIMAWPPCLTGNHGRFALKDAQ
ncbi:hypothetical protein EJB05_57439, partial [Eragrostis curvula]